MKIILFLENANVSDYDPRHKWVQECWILNGE